MKDLLKMEESLWERRMKVLYQYKRVQEMKDKIAELEKIIEEELGVDMQTALVFVEAYENNPEEVVRFRETFGEEIVRALQTFVDRIKQIQEMKREIDEVEREVFEIDREIDEAFELLEEYRRRIQGLS